MVTKKAVRRMRAIREIMGAENLVSSCSPISAHCAGIASVWPIRMRRASNLGLAVINASSLIPYFRAIPAGVSPAKNNGHQSTSLYVGAIVVLIGIVGAAAFVIRRSHSVRGSQV